MGQRQYFDLGLAFALEDPDDLSPGTVGISALGLRSEFVFPWKKFELGLEPRAFYSVTWSTDELRDDYGVVGIRTDARYPLFDIGDKTLAGVLYVQPGWFVDALNLSSDGEESGTAVQQQIEIGHTTVVGQNGRHEFEGVTGVQVLFDPGDPVVLADAEFPEQVRQVVAFDGLDGRSRIGKPEHVVAIVLLTGHRDFTPDLFHIAIVFIAIRNHENVITLERDFDSVFHHP